MQQMKALTNPEPRKSIRQKLQLSTANKMPQKQKIKRLRNVKKQHSHNSSQTLSLRDLESWSNHVIPKHYSLHKQKNKYGKDERTKNQLKQKSDCF